jgi:hypothetical protein
MQKNTVHMKFYTGPPPELHDARACLDMCSVQPEKGRV